MVTSLWWVPSNTEYTSLTFLYLTTDPNSHHKTTNTLQDEKEGWERTISIVIFGSATYGLWQQTKHLYWHNSKCQILDSCTITGINLRLKQLRFRSWSTAILYWVAISTQLLKKIINNGYTDDLFLAMGERFAVHIAKYCNSHIEQPEMFSNRKLHNYLVFWSSHARILSNKIPQNPVLVWILSTGNIPSTTSCKNIPTSDNTITDQAHSQGKMILEVKNPHQKSTSRYRDWNQVSKNHSTWTIKKL